MSERNQVAAIILAGGRSSRMGKDKAGLTLNGQTFLERTIQVVNELVDQIVIMRAPGQVQPDLAQQLAAKVQFGRDSVEGQGPLQGIADGMRLLNDEIDRVFLLTCDLPCLSLDWLQHLQNSLTDEYDLVCTEESQISNPLLAIYRRPVLEPAQQFLDTGERRPFQLWQGWRVLKTTVPESLMWICQDVNTHNEFQQLKTFLRKQND